LDDIGNVLEGLDEAGMSDEATSITLDTPEVY